MKQTINFSQFHDAFRNMDRLDNFSYQGLRVLYDWFEMIEDCDESEVELDVVAICCEFSEATPGEIANSYGIDRFPFQSLLDYLNDHTLVCGQTDTTIVYADF